MGKIEGLDSSQLFEDPLRFKRALHKILFTGSSIIEERIIESMISFFGTPPPSIGESFDQKISMIYSSFVQRKTGLDQHKIDGDLPSFLFNS